MTRVSFERLWIDDDGMLALMVRASNGRQAGEMEIYLYPDDLRSFGARLQAFPTDMSDEVTLETGGDGPTWYGHFLMRAFVLDASRCALEILMDTRGEPPSEAKLHFYLQLEAASANRLGRAIEGWNVMNGQPLEFSDGRG